MQKHVTVALEIGFLFLSLCVADLRVLGLYE